LTDPADPFRVTGYSLVTTMMVLAILEHWFLVMPPSAAKIWNGMWQWSLGSRGVGGKARRQQQAQLPRQATIGGHP
jgi:hypothetical protein